MIKLNQQWSIDADQYQYIVLETTPTKEGSKNPFSTHSTYHPTLERCANYITDKAVRNKIMAGVSDLKGLTDELKSLILSIKQAQEG